jgi:hypothetical protein
VTGHGKFNLISIPSPSKTIAFHKLSILFYQMKKIYFVVSLYSNNGLRVAPSRVEYSRTSALLYHVHLKNRGRFRKLAVLQKASSLSESGTNIEIQKTTLFAPSFSPENHVKSTNANNTVAPILLILLTRISMMQDNITQNTATQANEGANRQSRNGDERIYFISHPADATDISQTSRTSLAPTSILFSVSLKASKADVFQTRFLKLSY